MSLHVGDCFNLLAGRRAEFEAAILDPPAGASFMGLRFDSDHGGADKWIEYMSARFAACREACIPGAYGLFWALPRTQDWTMTALRKAGWRITDVVQHVFGQGWPKGQGQLKPAQESWILCRDPRGKVRPLNIDGCRVGNDTSRGDRYRDQPPGGGDFFLHNKVMDEPWQAPAGRYPANLVLSHCDACRCVGMRKVDATSMHGTGTALRRSSSLSPAGGGFTTGHVQPVSGYADPDGTETVTSWECLAVCSCGLASRAPAGGAPTPCECGGVRWWACPVAMLDEQSGALHGAGNKSTLQARGSGVYEYGLATVTGFSVYKDTGGASRFFPQFHYDAKASRRERQAGCEGLFWVRDEAMPIGWRLVSREEFDRTPEDGRRIGNVHATIKPVGCDTADGLMRWLVRLVTPEGGPVLDGMMGSGSTGIAAQFEGRGFFGCDIDPGAVAIASARMAHWLRVKGKDECSPCRSSSSRCTVL